jgi:hypothetical protein
MAPAWDEDSEDTVRLGEAEGNKDEDEDVNEDVDDGVRVTVMIPVGILVDSVALELRSAAAGLNPPPPRLISRYAQPGTAVPEGVLLGNTRG